MSGCSNKKGAAGAAKKKPATGCKTASAPCPCPTKVEFKEKGDNYGFDDHTNSAVPWKSVEKGKSDTVKTEITPADKASKATFVSKKTSKVTVSPASASSANQTVTVTGVKTGTAEVQGTCKGGVLGKMKVKTYAKKTKTVAVRVVHEKNYKSTNVSDAKIETFLKKVYKQAVFEFKITRLKEKTVKFDKNGDGKVDVGSWMSDEMKAIRNACKDDSYDHNIFLVNNPSDGSTGFMNYNQRYGFVHADISSRGESTLAHELGHGGFALTHTPGDADNIMYNYSSTTKWRLRMAQWDKIN